MARRLTTIAKFINEELDGYSAAIVRGCCNTDQKIYGSKAGRGRYGDRMIVTKGIYDPCDVSNVVLDHDASETYRRNQEVEDWLDDLPANKDWLVAEAKRLVKAWKVLMVDRSCRRDRKKKR